MTKKSFLQSLLVFTAVLIGAGMGYAGWKTWQDMKNAPAMMSEPTGEGQKLGFLYLLYAGSAPESKASIYNVKSFDPETQKIEQIASVTLPVDVSSVSYADGKLFYVLSAPAFFPVAIISYDLRTGQSRTLAKTSSTSPGQHHILPSYLLVQNTLFFLNCLANDKNASESSDCRLEQVALGSGKDRKTKRELNLSEVFKDTRSQKKIEAYDPQRHAIVLSEYLSSSTYESPDINYYQVFLDRPHEVSVLTPEAMTQLENALGDRKKERCSVLTLDSGVFERERAEGVFPPQIRIGYFKLRELRALSR